MSILIFMVLALAVAGGVLYWTKVHEEQVREAERDQLLEQPDEADGGGLR